MKNLIFFIIILNLILNISSAQVLINEKELLPVVVHSQWGFINRTGKIVIQLQFQDAEKFSEGFASIKLDGKYGYIDITGQIVIKPQFDMAEKFSDGLAIVKINDNYGYIDKTGKVIIPAKFTDSEDFENGIADVYVILENPKDLKDSNNPKHLYIDKTGKYLTDLNVVSLCCEGMILVRDEHKRGFIDSTGKLVIQPQFDDAHNFNEDLAVVKENNKWGCIDKTGKYVIPTKYEFVNEHFSEGLLGVKINDKWGYIDKTGNVMIEPQFDEVNLFSDGMASVLKDHKRCYIDKTGKIVIDHNYSQASKFQNGVALVVDNIEFKEGSEQGTKKGWLIIDNTGKQIGQVMFVKNINRFEEGFACVKGLDNKYSYIDQKGNFITEMKFDNASPWFQDGVAQVFINKKMGYIDITGKYIWEPSE